MGSRNRDGEWSYILRRHVFVMTKALDRSGAWHKNVAYELRPPNVHEGTALSIIRTGGGSFSVG